MHSQIIKLQKVVDMIQIRKIPVQDFTRKIICFLVKKIIYL